MSPHRRRACRAARNQRFPDIGRWMEVDGYPVRIFTSRFVEPGTALIMPPRGEDAFGVPEPVAEWVRRGGKLVVGHVAEGAA